MQKTYNKIAGITYRKLSLQKVQPKRIHFWTTCYNVCLSQGMTNAQAQEWADRITENEVKVAQSTRLG